MYITITGKVEEVNVREFSRQLREKQGDAWVSHEVMAQSIEVTLTIPTMRDRLRVAFTPEDAPSSDKLDQWELDESWVIITSSGVRANAFNGARGMAALVTFTGTDIREATPQERQKLQQARKAAKQEAKARRATAPAKAATASANGAA